MYNVKLNKERLKHHMQYEWRLYLLYAIGAVLCWSVLTSVFAYRVPDEEKIEIYLVGEYVFEERLDNLEQSLRLEFPDIEEIEIYQISFTGTDDNDMYAQQKLMVMLGSQTGDIYFFHKEDFRALIKQGLFYPLDDLLGMEADDYILEEEYDYTKGIAIDLDETEEKLYGMTMYDSVMFENTGYITEEKIMGVTGYCKNPDDAIRVLKWIKDNRSKVFYKEEPIQQ